MGEIMKDDVHKIFCGKEIKVHLRRMKQLERRQGVRELHYLPSDSKVCSSPKTHWSHVPFVSVDKISIDQPSDWNGRSIGNYLNSCKPISGRDTPGFVNDISVTNRSAAEQSGHCSSGEDGDFHLGCTVLINGRSPTIPLERLSLSPKRGPNSKFKGKKLTFDDQNSAHKENDKESLLKRFSPTVSLRRLSLKRLSLPVQRSGNAKVKDDKIVNSEKVGIEPKAMPSYHRRGLQRKWLESRLTLRRSPRRASLIALKAERRMSQTHWKINTPCSGPEFTGRSMSPVIIDAVEEDGKQRGHGNEKLRTNRKRSVAQVETRADKFDKRKSDILSKMTNLKQHEKRQKLKHAFVNEYENSKGRSASSEEDEVSITLEDDQREGRSVDHSLGMNTWCEKKSSQENGKMFDESRGEIFDEKTSNILDECRNSKELGKKQKLKVRDAKVNGDGGHITPFSQEDRGKIPECNQEEKEIDQSNLGMSVRDGKNPSSQNQNAQIFNELTKVKIVMRPLRKNVSRRLLPSSIAALLMKPHKPKRRRNENPSDNVDQNGNEKNLFAEYVSEECEAQENSGTGQENLKRSSTVNMTEKITPSKDKKMIETQLVSTLVGENEERRLEIEKKMMEGKLEGDALLKKVEYNNVADGVNEFELQSKKQVESSSLGINTTSEMCENREAEGIINSLRRDATTETEGSVQSVRLMQTEKTEDKRKCGSNTFSNHEIEVTSKTLRRKDIDEVDYVSKTSPYSTNFDKEKENDPGKTLGIIDSKIVPPSVTDELEFSKLEEGNFLRSISKESRGKEYKERLSLQLKEAIERASKDQKLHKQGMRNLHVSQAFPEPESIVEVKDVECSENLDDELYSNKQMKLNLKSVSPAEIKKSECFTFASVQNIAESHSSGDVSYNGITDNSQQSKHYPVSSSKIVSTIEQDQTDADDDIVLEFIKSPKSVNSHQILSFMEGLFQTQDARDVPSPGEILEELKKTFRQNMSGWELFVRKHWEIMVARRIGATSVVTQEKPLATVGKYSLSDIDMASLENACWVNDNIINSYLHLLSNEAPLWNASFSSFFYQVYLKNGFEHVQRWHRKMDIFACRLILVPIHSRHHWCLVAVDIKEKTITFFDSMRSGGMRYLKKIMAYMNEEAVARQNAPIEWILQSKDGIPKQQNTSDCGVFVCQYAKRLCYGKQVMFSHSEATHFRQLMKQELLTKKVEPP